MYIYIYNAASSRKLEIIPIYLTRQSFSETLQDWLFIELDTLWEVINCGDQVTGLDLQRRPKIFSNLKILKADVRYSILELQILRL